MEEGSMGGAYRRGTKTSSGYPQHQMLSFVRAAASHAGMEAPSIRVVPVVSKLRQRRRSLILHHRPHRLLAWMQLVERMLLSQHVRISLVQA
jgi:hypothetical protein